MIKLIKNELIKIFHKKTIYVMLIIMLAFVALVTIINNCSFDNESLYNNYNSEYIDMLKTELSNLDYKNPDEVLDYINTKTELEQMELLEKYGENSWQAEIINNTLYSYLYDLNVYQYGNDMQSLTMADEELLRENYNKILSALDRDDWKYFVNQELNENKETLKNLEEQKNHTINTEDIDANIKKINTKIDLLNYRLKNEVSYGNTYLSEAIDGYYNLYSELIDIENNKNTNTYYYSQENSEYEQKIRINEIKQDIALYKYILETKQDINNMYNLRGALIEIFDNYEIIIIVLIVIISGSIVSEEFNKGTIKLLLTRPYKRSKILLAKFITIIIIILFAIISLIIMQFILGLIFYGTESLNIPAVIYNFNTSSIQTMSILKLLLINTLAKLPLYILVSTIAFFISTIFSNTSIGITIALLGYMSTSIINTLIGLAYKNNIKFLKYFITMHWDFNQYLFGKLPNYEYINLPLSIIICILYFLIMIITTFIVFERKDIKNI